MARLSTIPRTFDSVQGIDYYTDISFKPTAWQTLELNGPYCRKGIGIDTSKVFCPDNCGRNYWELPDAGLGKSGPHDNPYVGNMKTFILEDKRDNNEKINNFLCKLNATNLIAWKYIIWTLRYFCQLQRIFKSFQSTTSPSYFWSPQKGLNYYITWALLSSYASFTKWNSIASIRAPYPTPSPGTGA